MLTINQSLSDAMWRLRGLAIISVATAHCVYLDDDLTIIKCMIGTIGVPIFFLLGGFFYNYNEKCSLIARKKIKRIMIPWIVWGLITFKVQYERGGVLYHNLWDIVKWISGYMTWLYFVPVILVFYAIFYFIRDKYIIPIIIVSIVNNILSAKGVTELPITIYQNPLNWIGWFSIGICIRRIYTQWGESESCKVIISRIGLILSSKVFFVISMSSVMLIGCFYYLWAKHTGNLPTYWCLMAVPFEVTSGIALLSLSLISKGRGWLYHMGKQSYAIYFMHFHYGKLLTIKLTKGELFNKIGIQYAWTIIIASIIVCTICLLTCLVLSYIDKMFLKGKVMWIFGII